MSSSDASSGDETPRNMSIALGIGIFFAPYLFAWLTLRPGYSIQSRAISFAWLGFMFFAALNNQSKTKWNLIREGTTLSCTGISPQLNKYDDGQLYISLRPRNFLTVVKKSSMRLTAGHWKQVNGELRLTQDALQVSRGVIERLVPSTDVIFGFKLLGKNSEGLDVIVTRGMEAQCVVSYS